ncbi:MAG: hypothetical protein V2I32_04705 [Desulforhopalus sp.]|nr:hypothetical protein [Desulforhopalus sp.]
MKGTNGLCVVAVLVFFLSSCALPPGGKQVALPLEPINCIAVLPAITLVNQDDSVEYRQAKSLERGAAFVSQILQAELTGHPKVLLVGESQLDKLVPEVAGGLSGMVSSIGEKLNCEAVLVTTVHRFEQRQGSEYAVDAPASAEVDLVLWHTAKKTVLWSADFQETQESLLSNLFSYNKMFSRGFKWLTVEQLVEEGVKERLGQCPYLQ